MMMTVPDSYVRYGCLTEQTQYGTGTDTDGTDRQTVRTDDRRYGQTDGRTDQTVPDG